MVTISAGSSDLGKLRVPSLALLVEQGAEPPSLGNLDRGIAAAVQRVLSRRDFRAGRDETLHLLGVEQGIERVLLVGMGKVTDRPAALKRAASVAARRSSQAGVGRLAIYAGDVTADQAEAIALGAIAGSWEMKEYQTPPPDDERRAPLAEVVVLSANAADAELGVARGRAIGEGHSLARRLGMLPGNVCTPEYLAETAREIAGRHNMKLTVLGRADMEREGMGSFLSVAQGTPQDPKLIALEYRRGGDKAPVALVGKGLCFDSGGISIKPAQGMEWMKFDMCGAAGVLGAMEAIGRLGLPVNVVGLVGSTTNMPSGTAVKPGDVVRASNGKFIEIINTDAEGRLVLADVLAYAKRFSPSVVIDAATLTGACVIALGHSATGVMGSEDGVVQEVLAACKRASEPGWPLPMWDDFKPLIKSDVADIKNSGGRPAGTITAALFLKEFAEGYPWVHLDIAGTAYSESDLVTIPAGPTGVPVGTFVEFVRGRAG
ncbi:MAG TPA: leucyl aminopeptidase [Gemmatimonadaceae bacterium]|nr:leucyl aminopeptidase [Gemmatimonadaceae bacterium]